MKLIEIANKHLLKKSNKIEEDILYMRTDLFNEMLVQPLKNISKLDCSIVDISFPELCKGMLKSTIGNNHYICTINESEYSIYASTDYSDDVWYFDGTSVLRSSRNKKNGKHITITNIILEEYEMYIQDSWCKIVSFNKPDSGEYCGLICAPFEVSHPSLTKNRHTYYMWGGNYAEYHSSEDLPKEKIRCKRILIIEKTVV